MVQPRLGLPARRAITPGFTLLELLVVISIIGMLVGLTLPAVQSARERGRRAQCQNNLRQIGLAVHDFHSKLGYLPASVRPGGLTTLPRTSWETYLLPYIAQHSLYHRLDLTENWSSSTINTGFAASNREKVASRVMIYECPSSTDPHRLDGDPQENPWTPIAAPTDYSTITNVEQRAVTAGLVDYAGLGIMPKNMRSSFDDVKDGLSNTILVVESAGRPRIYRKRVAIGSPPTQRVNGGGWCRPGSDFGLDGASWDGAVLPGPCAINCTNGEDIGGQTFPYPAPYGSDGTGETFSFHPQGANVLFADGSVHFAWEKVDIRLFAKLVTRDQNDVASVDDLEYK